MIDVSDLDPELAARILSVESAWRLRGPDHQFFTKTSGARSFSRQFDLYDAWTSGNHRRFNLVSRPAAPGFSRHHPFLSGRAAAVDIDVDPASRGTVASPLQTAFGALVEEFDLVWGGRWQHPDFVHVELRGFDPRALARRLFVFLDTRSREVT